MPTSICRVCLFVCLLIHPPVRWLCNRSKGAQEGAYAISVSGKYKDNKCGATDDAASFWYSGEGKGGGKGGVNQTFENAANAALLRNHETGTPVRVVRAVQAPRQQKQYVYEGLYQVAEYKHARGSDGFLVSYDIKVAHMS
jgi:hypothetical protein